MRGSSSQNHFIAVCAAPLDVNGINQAVLFPLTSSVQSQVITVVQS